MIAGATTMKAWVVETPGPIATGPLVAVERPIPEPGPGEIRVRVVACGVCRTDLHLAVGDLPPHRPSTVPGHEVVGTVDALGAGASRFQMGQRAGIAWLRHTCGRCRWCRRGRENLCIDPRFTGWDADGGYAQWAVVDEAYAYELPDSFDDVHAAPLLCAGIIGYRALRRAELPPGGRLGIYGFGASAHLAAQVALAARRDRARHDPRGGRPPARARPGRGTPPGPPTPRPPSRSTPPSCSRQPEIWCPPRWPPSTVAARWPSPAST